MAGRVILEAVRVLSRRKIACSTAVAVDWQLQKKRFKNSRRRPVKAGRQCDKMESLSEHCPRPRPVKVNKALTASTLHFEVRAILKRGRHGLILTISQLNSTYVAARRRAALSLSRAWLHCIASESMPVGPSFQNGSRRRQERLAFPSIFMAPGGLKFNDSRY